MSSYSSLLSASGWAFGVEKGCSESGEGCITLEVLERVSPPGRFDSPGRRGAVKWCWDGCILFEVVPLGRDDATKLSGCFTGDSIWLGEIPPDEGTELHYILNNWTIMFLTSTHNHIPSWLGSWLGIVSCSLFICSSSTIVFLVVFTFAV